jgi:hypothetical protein
MKRIAYLSLLVVLFAGRPATAATLEHPVQALANTGGLSLQASTKDQQTLDLIDKVNEYNFAQLLIDSGEAARVILKSCGLNS